MPNKDGVEVRLAGTVDVTLHGAPIVSAGRFASKTSDELRLEVRAMQHELLDREVGRYRGLLPADMNIYQHDNAPREGCTLVVHLEAGKWAIDAYAPGYAPIGPAGLMRGYGSRPHGSIGIAIQAIIDHGFDWRHALPEMKKAEKAYSERKEELNDTEVRPPQRGKEPEEIFKDFAEDHLRLAGPGL